MPRSFGGVSKKILQCLINNTASRVAIVFDRYFTPSIKDYEHSLRGSVDDKEFHISGPQQTRTADFTKDLKNIKFKEAIVKFFIDHWADQEMAAIIGSKVIYIIHDLCYEYSVTDNKVTRIINYELSCPDHEEADTKVAFLACQQKEDSTITIRTSDTDIVVIMLANIEHLQATVEVWMDIGVGNARRYIDVSALYNKLGPKISKALPALHAFTGCDFNPAFYRRGKKKPLQILMSSETFQQAFLDLGSKEYNLQDSLNVIQSFTCHLYGLKKLDDVNQARIVIFNKTYKVKDTSQPFSLNIRNYDACNLPPCQSELLQQVLRTRFIACMWSNAHNAKIIDLLPTDYGWKIVDGKFEMIWFAGDQLPKAYEDVVITPDTLEDTPELDTQSEDEIEPEEEDDSTDEDEN
ncbi:uncharacterized protein [Diabrotica undecimpunctata]|uniref:uncharacterized protein n=2 Tax=Diabrotica undecimpunctata TaxID=50387 RepID=UPI003B637A60